jgi:ribosome-associated heat shock protein Hsp15
MSDSVRLDKFVWAIRCYKTRSEATDACNGNKVQLNGAPAKPSKAVKVGDTVSVRKGVALYTFKVLQIAEQRMGAQKVPEFAENLTPQSEIDKLRAPHETFFVRRDRGAGRPTKKDRREMDAIWDGNDFSSDPFDGGDDDDDDE